MLIKMTLFCLVNCSLIASSTFNEISNARRTIDSYKSNKNNLIKFMGSGSKLRDVVSINEVVKTPDKYLDKNITIQGKVLDLCRKAGCWISIIDTQGNKITAKGNHSDIVFPVNAIGGKARITGKFKKHVLTLEQTIKYEAHMAKDRGEKFDVSSVKNPKTLYRIHATGAVIFLAKK